MSTPPLVTVALRHSGSWPLAFGDYSTGGVIHQVDPATAERLLARGFERVHPDPAPAAPDAAPLSADPPDLPDPARPDPSA